MAEALRTAGGALARGSAQLAELAALDVAIAPAGRQYGVDPARERLGVVGKQR